MSSLYDSPELNTAQATASAAQGDYLNSATRDATLPDLLRKALNDKFTNNNPLMQDLNTARGNYLNTTTSAPLSVLPENNNGIIFNPAQQEDLINRRKTAALSPVMLLNDLLGIQTGGIQNVIDSTSRAAAAETMGKKGKADTAQNAFQNLLDLVSKRQSEKEFNLNYNLEKEKLAKGTPADQQKVTYQNMIKDIKGKATLRSILTKYSGDFSADDIYAAYNTSSPWGVAKEDASVLSTLGIKIIPTQTAEQRNRKSSIDPALAFMAGISENEIDKGGVQNKGFVEGSIKNFGGIGVNSDVVSLNQKYMLLKQNVVRALQGARMSDKDIEIAGNYIPSIVDTPEVARTKLKNLDIFMNALVSGGSSGSTPKKTQSTTKDPLGLGL